MSTVIQGEHVAVHELTTLYIEAQRPLTIIETGTVRMDGEDWARADGHSTLHIAEWIRRTGVAHKFYSLDLATATCARVLESRGLSAFVTLCEGDSAVTLSGFSFPIDFAYLDSCKEPEQNLLEFQAVHTRGVQVVVIDDVYNRDEVNKGKLTMPLALSLGYTCEQAAGRLAILRRAK
jgi:predicted O-methyltransferase YrrM